MKLIIFLILLVVVQSKPAPGQREKSPATKVWEWFDDNMPTALRPVWREINQEFLKMSIEQYIEEKLKEKRRI